MRIFMACVQYWSSPFQVGSHHLAQHFLQAGHDVAFLSEPISPLHVVSGLRNHRRDRLARLGNFMRGGEVAADGRLWSYVPCALFTPADRFALRHPFLQRHWNRLSVPSVVNKARRRGFASVDLLYIDSLKQLFWLDQIRYRRAVYRMADYNPGFPHYTKAMHEAQAELARRVDLVVYTSPTLEDHVHTLSPRRAVCLPNGVNLGHFAGPFPQPPEFRSLPRPIAVYVGALEAWFDGRLVLETARRLPWVSFVIIGPKSKHSSLLEGEPNIVLLGSRSYRDLPAYLKHADVGLIPFDRNQHRLLVNSINPVKLYEYMAAGLPVVAVETDDLRQLDSPARLTRTTDEFCQAVASAVSQTPNQSRLHDFAASATWKKRCETLLDAAA